MSKEMEFFIFLIEGYASYKGISASEVLTELEQQNLIDYVYMMYERYHQERIENAYMDIDRLLDFGDVH